MRRAPAAARTGAGRATRLAARPPGNKTNRRPRAGRAGVSHTGVDVIDFLLLTAWPALALLGIEGISRAARAPRWAKLAAQAAASVAFAVAYVTLLPVPHWLTSLVLVALAVALIYQARRAHIDPSRVPY